MKKLAFGVVIVWGVSLTACKGTSTPPHLLPDGAPADSAGGPACNVLTQMGCATGQKCTWFHDDMSMPPIGHIDCAPDGTVAVGGACSYGPPGATGFDNCKAGSVCPGERADRAPAHDVPPGVRSVSVQSDAAAPLPDLT